MFPSFLFVYLPLCYFFFLVWFIKARFEASEQSVASIRCYYSSFLCLGLLPLFLVRLPSQFPPAAGETLLLAKNMSMVAAKMKARAPYPRNIVYNIVCPFSICTASPDSIVVTITESQVLYSWWRGTRTARLRGPSPFLSLSTVPIPYYQHWSSLHLGFPICRYFLSDNESKLHCVSEGHGFFAKSAMTTLPQHSPRLAWLPSSIKNFALPAGFPGIQVILVGFSC